MEIVKDVSQLRKGVMCLRSSNNQPIGFVPTMGYLHEGHLSLVRELQQTTPNIVVSIFVNPTQFNNPQDFEKYPIDLDRDFALLAKENVSLLFCPSKDEFYGEGFQSWVELSELAKPLEGVFRPGHFKGMTTVVSMLFNAVQADIAAFGEKDFQQLRLIERMVQDLKIPVEIVRGETVREADGLAMSSRNVRLSAPEREQAVAISRGLLMARRASAEGEVNAKKICEIVTGEIRNAGFGKIDYVSLVDEETLLDVAEAKAGQRLLVAAYLGDVRLIDNLRL